MSSCKISLGIAILLVCISNATASAPKFTTLVNFDNSNGANPVYPTMVQGTDGNFYGTTIGGGVNSAGTVFKMTPAGSVTILYSFCSLANCADGSGPYGGLVRASNGNFYGTTYSGGASSWGTVFVITPTGVLTTLHSFNGTDGGQPLSSLVASSSGQLYGTTNIGGPDGYGTLFTISLNNTFTTLHTFDGADGNNPTGALVQGTDGNFYGTTEFTVFRITPGGVLTTLHTFDITDGRNPYGALIQAKDGNFYGTTYDGGADNSCDNGCGTVFSITLQGSLTTLYNFDSTGGYYPIAGLWQGTDGNFYGTTYAGGPTDWGTVYELTLKGVYRTLHSFDLTDGGQPYGAVVQGTNGILYGTATEGGADSLGTVFSIGIGLSPFIETQPTSGKIGMHVVILGNGLSSASRVTFNGTAAGFKVVSDTEITTTVPTGATTGQVQVTTPTGTLTGNVVFRVK
jgi:uncharacterized repeat protein (TIGR03803 family)